MAVGGVPERREEPPLFLFHSRRQVTFLDFTSACSIINSQGVESGEVRGVRHREGQRPRVRARISDARLEEKKEKKVA